MSPLAIAAIHPCSLRAAGYFMFKTLAVIKSMKPMLGIGAVLRVGHLLAANLGSHIICHASTLISAGCSLHLVILNY